MENSDERFGEQVTNKEMPKIEWGQIESVLPSTGDGMTIEEIAKELVKQKIIPRQSEDILEVVRELLNDHDTEVVLGYGKKSSDWKSDRFRLAKKPLWDQD